MHELFLIPRPCLLSAICYLLSLLLSGCGSGDFTSLPTITAPDTEPPASVTTAPPPASKTPPSLPLPTPEPAPTPTPTSSPTPEPPFPEGFTYLWDVCPGIASDLRYATPDNFTGAVVDGYEDPSAVILTVGAAQALALVQDDLCEQGLALKVWDAYRPQRAADAFVRWAETPDDPTAKAVYYPNEDKTALFDRGYIARRSPHSRGSTVDLTLIRMETGEELDMGTTYDFLDARAAHNASGLNNEQRANRQFLRGTMTARGFAAYSKEWWHYTLRDEPFPKTYFDFIVR